VSEFKRRHLGELPQQMDAQPRHSRGTVTQLRLNADNQTRATDGGRRCRVNWQKRNRSLPPRSWRRVDQRPRLKLPRLVSPGLKKSLTGLVLNSARNTRTSSGWPLRCHRDRARACRRKSREPKGNEKPAAPQATPLTPYLLRLKEALSEAERRIKS